MRLLVTRDPTAGKLTGDLDAYRQLITAAFGRPVDVHGVLEHTVESDVFVEVLDDGSPVAFAGGMARSAATVDRPLAYLHAVIVLPAYQRRGLAATMLAQAAAALVARDERAVVCGTTMHPALVGLLSDLFGTHPDPRADDPVTPGAADRIERVAATLFPDCEVDPPVVVGRYDGSLYPEVPDHPLRSYTDPLLDYERGDAVLAAGEVTGEQLERTARARRDPVERVCYR